PLCTPPPAPALYPFSLHDALPISIVPGRKFSRRTSLCPTSVRRIAWPSGALRFKVTLFLLRLTDMKYVDSPPAKGGQLRVSSPLDRKSTRLNSSHQIISYAVFCLK